jgi:hypothetical protein
VLATPQVQSYQGLPYGALLAALAAGAAEGADQAQALARAAPAMVARAYSPTGDQGSRDPGAAALLAFSAADPAVVRDQLAPALDELGGALLDVVARDPAWASVVRAALLRAPSYAPGLVDLGALLQVLEHERQREATRPEATAAAARATAPLEAARRALDASVLAHALGEELISPSYTGFSGAPAARALSIWTPSRLAPHDGQAVSGSTLHRVAPRWSAWLRMLAN